MDLNESKKKYVQNFRRKNSCTIETDYTIIRLKITVSVIWILFNRTLRGQQFWALDYSWGRFRWSGRILDVYICSPLEQNHNYCSAYLSSGGNRWTLLRPLKAIVQIVILKPSCVHHRDMGIFAFPSSRKGRRHLVENLTTERAVPRKWQHSNLRPTHLYRSEAKRRRNRPVTRSVETLTPSSQTIDRGNELLYDGLTSRGRDSSTISSFTVDFFFPIFYILFVSFPSILLLFN